MTSPTISIIIPSFNSGEFIGEAIRSVIEQDYPHRELIVIDGGSTDATLDVVEKYRSQIAYFVSEPDRGQSHALNKGFIRSTGTIMTWLCANDYYLPGAFSKAAQFFAAHPDARFVYGNGFRTTEQGTVIRELIEDAGPPTDILDYNHIISTSAFWKRSLWEKAGGYIDESNYYTMDWELFIRMSPHERFHYLPEKLACFRQHEASKTMVGTDGHETSRRDREIVSVARKHGGYFCFNSVAYELKRFAGLNRHFRFLPKPLYSLMFRALHVPVKMAELLSGQRSSMILGKAR